ncbi:MAG TPA: Bug family tripartite tricarboxylate transporter substrate binding protein [Burkholderiales bacterium]|nr:Bug family tripartite tricarboxylate transporter substrate binding protein [Burkholderiales bacterium]
MHSMRFVAALLSLALALPAAAQEKTIKFLVGFPAGAGLDTMTRLVADKMRVKLGQPVLVENRPGADGRIVMDALKIAPPDGLTLVMTPLVTVVTAPQVFKNLRYDPFADFAPVAHAASFLFAFAVGPNVPAKSLAEYVAYVKQDPKNGSYASAGAGSLPHFFSVLFAQNAGIPMVHIGYKGSAPAITDLIGGQISAFMGTASDLAAQHKAGKLRVIATSGAQRARVLPDVPTFREQGYNIEGGGWYAAYAPAKTPPAEVERLAAAIIEGIHAPDVREKLETLGMEPTGLGPAELARIHRADYDKWGPVIRASGFKPE